MVPENGSPGRTESGQEVPRSGALTSEAEAGRSTTGAIPGSVEELRQTTGAALGGDGGAGAAGEGSAADETRSERVTSELDADADRRRRNEGDGISAFDETEAERQARLDRDREGDGKPKTLMDEAGRTESAATRSARLAREKDQTAAADPSTLAARTNADKVNRLAPTPGLSDARTSPGTATAPVVGADQAAHRRQTYGATLRTLRDNVRHDFGGHSHVEDVVQALEQLDGMIGRLIEDNTSK